MKKIKNIFGSKKEKKSKNPNPTGSIAKYNQSEVDGFLLYFVQMNLLKKMIIII